MKILIKGGGPAGLYLAVQMKLADPSYEVVVHERNKKGSTYGWGVVFSDATLENFEDADPISYRQIIDNFYHWDDIEVHFNNTCKRSSGHGFCGLGRQTLLDILDTRANQLGVQIHYESNFNEFDQNSDADLLVAADGIFSSTRKKYTEYFKPLINWGECKYIWLGTEQKFPAFTFSFKETEYGWFQAHCYQFSNDMSTCIIECPEQVWRDSGIEQLNKEDGIKFCEELFSDLLNGNKLISNSEHLQGSEAWITFPQLNCETWFHNNIVLLGDASASAHFSIGSGTKLAMESAIELARQVHNTKDLVTALTNYQEIRRLEILRLQSAARNSRVWFENVHLKTKLKSEQFYYSLLTRSQRVSHENLRLRDTSYLHNYENWFAEESKSNFDSDAPPPIFIPFKLGKLELQNRIAVSPMATYSASEGLISDFHLVHIGARALGGAGLIFTEMTCISPEARITPGCAGIYTDDQQAAWKRIVDFVHSHSNAKIAMQLGHAGRKGSTKIAWEGMDQPLDHGNWPIYAPSAIPYTSENQQPISMTSSDMDKVCDDFVAATERTAAAGFDLLELHCAHGYLLSSFISPLCNKRDDEYGGSLENRLRFPLRVLKAIREVWPHEKPISVRISATDWKEGGIDISDSVEIARAFAEHGADCIDVSAGQVVADQKPVYGRMFQTPFADQIRSELGIATMAVGNIYEPDHVNSILAAGRADLCLLARPHLANPNWTQHAAAELNYEGQFWPNQYLAGRDQFYTLTQRAKEATK